MKNNKINLMTSSRPYLIRALYDWIVDNRLTPYLLVNAEHPNLEVPNEFLKEDKIVLNISTEATQELTITNEFIEFDASFSGYIHHLVVPISAALAIYAFENSRGMVFTEEDHPEEGSPTLATEIVTDEEPPPTSRRPKRGRPKLTVVK